jgi:cytochrome P450
VDPGSAIQVYMRTEHVSLAAARSCFSGRRYPAPDQFDVTRKAPVPHRGLGWSIHFFRGAQLARLEAEARSGRRATGC